MQDSPRSQTEEEEWEAALLLRNSDTAPRRLRSIAAAALAVLGLAAGAFNALLLFGRGRGPASSSLRGVEEKYFDASGEYWQAPGKAVSGSELWLSCQHPHMGTCSGYCCCDAGFYWRSPKTMYKDGKALLKKAVLPKATVGTTASLSGAAANVSVDSVALKLGKRAVTDMLGKDQHCIPKSEVPVAVVKALQDGVSIPGSDRWNTCTPFTPNSHTCGNYCCCNGGRQWSSKTNACEPA